MGKREDNKRAKDLNRETLGAIQKQLKGTGWKKKHHTFFREINNNFYCASAIPLIEIYDDKPKISMSTRYESKPMGIDPIYWDIAQLPDNKKKPLSFRAWAAFKTEPASFHSNTMICENLESIDDVASVFINWVKGETLRLQELMEKRPFSEVYITAKGDLGPNNTHTTTLICALILEGKQSEALEIARDLAPNEFRNLIVGTNFDDRVNFYELTILHLAGEKAFRKEVRKKPDSGLFKRKKRKFPWT